jgi:GMP synthase-like glutamine amidotransferase
LRIVCLMHFDAEGPGAIASWAALRGHSMEIARPYLEGWAHPGPFDMLVVMGGPMSVHQEIEYPWLAEEKRLISSAVESDSLVLGVCLGAQLVADVMGASVTRGPHREIGWFPVRLTQAGHASRILGGLQDPFDAFHWHGDTFDVPAGAVRTASSEAFENQAFEYDEGRVVAVQFHLELDAAAVAVLAERFEDELAESGEYVQAASEMRERPERFELGRSMLFRMLDAMSARRVSIAK